MIDLDKEAHNVRSSINLLNQELTALRASYADKKAIHDRLVKEVAVFDARLAFAEMGVYEPHFDYTDSEDYKLAIEAVRTSQKSSIANKSAVICPTVWTVDGSTAKGETMTNRAMETRSPRASKKGKARYGFP